MSVLEYAVIFSKNNLLQNIRLYISISPRICCIEIAINKAAAKCRKTPYNLRPKGLYTFKGASKHFYFTKSPVYYTKFLQNQTKQ